MLDRAVHVQLLQLLLAAQPDAVQAVERTRPLKSGAGGSSIGLAVLSA
jgi:hypothetical protein